MYQQVEEVLADNESKDRIRRIQSVLNTEEKKWRARYVRCVLTYVQVLDPVIY